jgi:hypothetical protein
MNSARFPIKVLLLVSERISYKLSKYIITIIKIKEGIY